MLRHVLFDLSLFNDETERENSQKRILCLLEALVWCNRLYLKQHPETPLIYQSGIKYIVPEQFEQAHLPEVDTVRKFLEKKGASADVLTAFKEMADQLGSGEHFRDIPRILENGGGDCDNVASWRVAELRELGIPAKPYITWRTRADGGVTYHVIVLHADGSSEDPSLLLGMGGETRESDRLHEEEKLGERTAEFIQGLAKYRNVAKARDLVLGHGATKRAATTVLGGLGSITTPQDYSQLQYSIPFQTDESYADWSPTRPQAYYANPLYPGLTPTSGPIFNTRMRDVDDLDDFDPSDKFDGLPGLRGRLKRKRIK